jgi:hypothetical protein
MFTYARIENFRGIERLEVSGLGRVNLIIGKNNAGKTAMMEAVWLAGYGEDAARALAVLQRLRRPDMPMEDFDGFWRPIFRGSDAERGFLVDLRRMKPEQARGEGIRVFMKKGRRSPPVLSTELAGGHSRAGTWSLECTIEHDGKSYERGVMGGSRGIEFPEPLHPAIANWIPAGQVDYQSAVRLLSLLKQQGRDSLVRDLLRLIDEQIEGFELLSPTGGQAAIFVRLKGETMLLPIRMMGDGAQRCLDIAVTLAGYEEAVLLGIDEIENGLHHSTLEPIWKWLATVSATQNIQIFATTHSEECVQAACRAFSALNDDGLRVIRLDRRAHETAATVYDRNLVAAAERMGVEIRG